ncbi:hypothetical protein EJD97_008514, partial [Solanum chilense]
ELASKFFKLHGFNRNQMESFNDFVERKLKEIVLGANVITSTVDPTVYLRYLDARIGIPPLRPRQCRLSDRTYDAPIEVIIEYISGRAKIEKKVTIGNMPIMLRSSRCILHGKDEDELTYLGECPLDTGGYFVIRGTEKVILIQEQPRKNNIMIDIDKMGRVQASVISSTKKTESTTVIRVEKEKIYLKSDQFKRKVPILIFMRAMGIESDLEVLILIGGDKDMRFADLLLPSIEECRDEKVYTQLQALKFLESETMLKVSSHSTGPVEEGARALRVLRDIIFAHIPVHQNNFHGKCTYVAVILRRVMEAILNKDAVDDKDYLGNKRYELCGDLLSLRFEHLFMQLNNETRKTVDALLLKQKKVDMSQISLSTGNWDSKQGRMHSKGVTQVVSRSSYAGLLAQMTRIVAQVEKSSEVSARQLHGSQFGMLCPCDTPIGESCGLVKHLALMAHVTLTIDEDESSIVFLQLCFSLGVEDLQYGSPELHMPTSYLIILNEAPIGTHRSPQIFANTMRKLRRKGRIGKFVSIFVNEKQGCVYIASDGGRVCRPLVIAEKGVSRIKEHHMNELKDGVRDFSSFLGDGLIEFLDVAEENNSLIAQCKREINPETTHIEIELFTTLGVCAGMIPYFDHNPSVSNTRQCAMGRKVMGNISYNQLSRMDTLMNLLVYPQRPLLTTRTAELVGYDKLGAGQNAIVAVMSDGYGSGNAIIMNKSSLDRGFGRCIVMKRYSAICRKYENLTSDRIVRPQREGKEAEIMQILDDDGLATPGEIIKPRDIYINKESPTITSSWTSRDRPPMRPSRQTYDGPQGETAVVDSVALYNDKHDNLCIKLMIRHTRRPEIGDTFCCRHGHKGVCGHIVQQEDFPFSESGICPDLIINPHGFPKELTVGKMMELLGSKAGALNGSFHYGTAFSEANHVDSVEAISKYLVMKKYNYGGKDFLYSGTLGMPIEAYIFTGPIYYQKLKHMVIDKMQAHATGKRSILTRQPIRGVRMGEMETGCLVSYGVSSVIYERLMISSDSYQAKVCKKCGLLGYTNHELQIGICSMCRNGDNIRTVTMPHALKLLIQVEDLKVQLQVEGNTADETQTKGSAPNTSFVNDPPKKLKRTILCSHSSSGGSSRKTSEVWDHYSEIILSRLDYTSSNSKNENPN